MWKRHLYRGRAAKFRPMLGAQGLLAGRDLYRATPAVTWGLRFSGLIRWIAPFSHLLRHTKGNPVYLISTKGIRQVWPVSRGCLLLRSIWSYLRICRRSMLPYTRFCNCLLDYDYVLHIVNLAILYYICTWTLKCLISVRKFTWFAVYLVVWTDFSTCQSANLRRRWLDLFCNYYHTQCVCNHSAAFVMIFNLAFFHIFGTSKISSLTYTRCL
jgi:hypothetical protein